jgi:hypothetical protein
MRQEFINEQQTSALRKFKYEQARSAGVSKALAGRMRDWRLTAIIGQIARHKGIKYEQAYIDFYVELNKRKITLWREKAQTTEVELSPEEDHEPI